MNLTIENRLLVMQVTIIHRPKELLQVFCNVSLKVWARFFLHLHVGMHDRVLTLRWPRKRVI